MGFQLLICHELNKNMKTLVSSHDNNIQITKYYIDNCIIILNLQKDKYIYYVCRVMYRGSEHYIYFLIYNNYKICQLPWNSVGFWYFAAIMVDFCYYWMHRASHGNIVSICSKFLDKIKYCIHVI